MDNEYLGFKELVITGEEVNDLFNPESENTFGCLKNEYLIASDENGNNIGMFKCNGHGVEKIPYKAIDTRFAGKVKARNPQQELAIDMLYDEDTTVKIIAGKFGTGKDFLMCSAAIDLLEHDKFEKIVYVRNNIEVKNSKPIGHLPGSYNEKLLPFAMPLADHTAISKAIAEVTNGAGDNSLATVITNRLDSRYRKRKRAISVEEIQDDIETELMKEQAFDIAKAYVRYRYQHEINRNGSSIERKILTIADGVNEEVIQENSNKNPTILSTQRDYMAGEVSREITKNTLLPKDILNAHEKGIIHFHDSDYFVQRMPNCCLVNLGDMLQNGTVISDTLIEKPHSFSTACNVATQVVAQVASNQYGGQSISLTHLAPFVDVSRQKIRKDVEEEIVACNGDINSIDSIVEKRLRDEIKRGVQTIQYTDDEAKPFALAIMQKMNDKCAEWKAAENIDYSLYGTPIESTTYKFAKCLQSRFGVIEGITDKNYITNSYHVHVTEKINAFDKLRFESEFQQLSPGGAISYIETANLSDNVDAALSVIKYIYYHIMYAELNTKSDFCQECGYDGEIQIVENEDGKLIWRCPNCGNTNRTKMNIARRTCGYIGVNDFNQGRTQEIKERYVHLGGE